MKELNAFRKFLAEGELNKDNYWKLGTVEEKLMRQAIKMIQGRNISKPTTLHIPLSMIPEAGEYLTDEYQTFKDSNMLKGEAKFKDEYRKAIEILMTPKGDLLKDDPTEIDNY